MLLLYPKMEQAIFCTAAKGYIRLYPKDSKIEGFNINGEKHRLVEFSV